jgi:hypothetical protein
MDGNIIVVENVRIDVVNPGIVNAFHWNENVGFNY